jgi:Cu-Zn family superoxide dismutase
MKALIKPALVTVMLVLVLSGCHGQKHSWFGMGGTPDSKEADHGAQAAASHTDGSKAVMASESTAAAVTVDLIGVRGTSIGKAKLTPVEGGVQFDVDAAYLPQGLHGFHVHENGMCAAPEFQTAGGHFNPDGKKHGIENPEQPHAGDLPNLLAGVDGKAKTTFVNNRVTLEKDKPNSLFKTGGTALVIHEKGDDNKTDPSGNSGARIACGVIQ